MGPGSPKAEEKSPAKKVFAGKYEINTSLWEVLLEGHRCTHDNCKFKDSSGTTVKKHYGCRRCNVFHSNKTDAVKKHDDYCQKNATKGEIVWLLCFSSLVC